MNNENHIKWLVISVLISFVFVLGILQNKAMADTLICSSRDSRAEGKVQSMNGGNMDGVYKFTSTENIVIYFSFTDCSVTLD